ncbi:MAG TPA: sugar ABC transporter substrate-binding protein [Thermoanaerobaculia bacterium]|nr:sugar ABC transporter substrate-binding protein [Thermoanaerobaculia bacterium]
MSGRAPALLAGWVVGCLVLAAAPGCGGARGDEETVVRFWGFGREGEVVRQMVPEFERRHPGIRVEVQQIPWTAAHEKLLTAFVGQATPDAAQLGNTWVPELVALGALAPLDEPIAASSEVDPGDYFAGVWDTNVLDGTVWGLPWYVDTRVLFFRTDLVAGGPWPPRSWSEWRRAMERIRDAGGPGRHAILLPIDEWPQPVILALQQGAPLLAEGGRRAAFEEPRFRRAMDFYTGLFADGLAAPLDQSTVANLYQEFAAGTFAMMITGPWNLGELERRLPAEMQHLWATAPLPPPEAGMAYPGASLAGGSSLVVFRRARSPAATWLWLEYLSQPEQQARFLELSGNLPARRSVWEAGGLAEDPRTAAFMAQLEHAVPTPKVPEWERIATRIAQAGEQVARGARSLDVALAGLNADVDRMLEKRRWMLDREAEAAADRAAVRSGGAERSDGAVRSDGAER